MYSKDFVIHFLLFVSQTGLIILSAFLTVSMLHKKMNSIEKTILFFLYSYAVPILLMTFLGIFGILKYSFVLAGLFVLNVILLLLKQKIGSQPWESPQMNWKILMVFSPLIIFLTAKFITAAEWSVVETDSLVYHLPFAAKWFQTETLWNPYYTAYSGPLGYYPGNYELLSLSVFFPFGEDVLVNLVNFPLLIAFGIILYALARKLGLHEWNALFAPSIFLFSPMIIRQAGIPQNDLFFIFSLAVAIYFSIRAYKQKNYTLTNWIPVAIALGLFMGTKSSGAIYAGLFLLIISAVFCIKRPKKMMRTIIAIYAITVIFGGFWYLRNFIFTGNPLFPLDVKIGNFHILKGYDSLNELYKNSALIAHFNFENIKLIFKNALLSIGLPLIILIGAFFISIFRFRKTNLLFLALIPSSFFLYLITPFSFANIYPNIRYLLPFFLLCYIMLLMVVKRGYFIAYFASLTSFIMIAKQKNLLEYVNDYVHYDFSLLWDDLSILGALAIGITALTICLCVKHQKIKMATSMVAIVCLGIFLNRSFIIREQRGYDSFTIENEYIYNENMIAAWKFIDENIPEDAKIAYTRGGAHYPLYGKYWKREIDYININDCTECVYHDFKENKNSILDNPDEKQWLDNLTKKNKEYLVILSKYFDDSKKIPFYEKEWTESNPEKFTLLFAKNDTFVYKIN